MIKANELRVGNLIKGNTGPETVRMILGHEGYRDNPEIHVIYKHLIGVEENMNQYNLAEINPLPITVDWLMKFGFLVDVKKAYIVHNEIGNIFQLNRVGDTFEFTWGGITVKSVHHLQNLYFNLINKELKLIA